MSKRDVVVLSAARSAVGTFGGSLSDIEPTELAGIVMKETIRRSGANPKLINYVTVGNTISTESRSAYVARVAPIQAGLPMESVAMAVNRLCSSGLQAIVTTAQNILLGDCDFGIGGGVEVMSRGAYISTAMRTGARMGDTNIVDMMVATLTDPFPGVGHMGVTAEIWPQNGSSRARSRTRSRPNRTAARQPRSRPAGSHRRSCPWSRKRRRARPSSTPTSM